MSESQTSAEPLNIKCSSCGKRFSVAADLMGRMVECGACDAQFRINDEVILNRKKFYPGERGSIDANRFKRVPLSSTASETMQAKRYEDFQKYDQLAPTSPQRILAGIVGVGLMLVIAAVLVFSSSSNGAMNAMPLENKLMMGGFVSIVGIFLLVYANPKARAKAGFFGLLIASILMAIPFLTKTKEPTITNSAQSIDYVDATEPLISPDETENAFTALRDRFSTNPLETEQKRLENSGSDKKAYGIYLTNLLQRNIYTVRDYLIRDTQAGSSSHPYPRDNGDYLMVLTDVSMGISEVAKITEFLGKNTEVHPEIGVIVVSVNNEQFVDNSAEKLNNQKDPAFYELNQRELTSIDMDRVKNAVERLSTAEPSIYRKDISEMFLKLMEKPGIRFHDELSKALLVWLDDPSMAAEPALKILQERVAAGETASENLVKLLLKGKNQKAIPSVHILWLGDPAIWERHYAEFGPEIEPNVLEQIDSENAILRRSAIKILGQVGSESSLPALSRLIGSEDPEIRVLAERAVKAIKER